MNRLLRGLCWLALTVALPSGSLRPATAQISDERFHEFAADLVPDPRQLGQQLALLNSLRQSGIADALLERLQEQGVELSGELTPRQRQRLADLAGNYLRERGLDPGNLTPQQLPGVMQQFGQQIQSDPDMADQIEQIRQQVAEFQRRQANGPPDPDPPRRPGFKNPVPGRTGPDRNPARGQPPGSRERPDDSRPSSSRTSPPAPSGRPPSRNGDNGKSSGPSPVAPTLPNDDLPAAGPPERIGVRFDRMIMEAARRGMETAEPASQSRFARSIGSLLDGLADQIDTMLERRRQRSEQPGLTPGHQGPARRRASGNGWTGWDGGTPASGLSVPALQPAWILAGIVVLVGSWLLYRSGVFRDPVGVQGPSGEPVRYRHRRLRSSADLVTAVDRFLLARFGRQSSWWDVRRAQQQLCAAPIRQVSDSRLDELATAYELARYSVSSGVLASSELDRLGETLGELAADQAPPAPQPAPRPGITRRITE